MDVNPRGPIILALFLQPYRFLPINLLTKYMAKLSPQSIEATLLASKPMPVVSLLLKTNSSGQT